MHMMRVNELFLNADEMEAFGVNDSSFHRHLLNFKGKSPCAVHSWGNKMTACSCGCRALGLASWRLEQKGLFGLLLRNAEGNIRHVHPNEAKILNGLDPVQDHGEQVRLTLSAVGQLASPLQSLWIFLCMSRHIETLCYYGTCFINPLNNFKHIEHGS